MSQINRKNHASPIIFRLQTPLKRPPLRRISNNFYNCLNEISPTLPEINDDSNFGFKRKYLISPSNYLSPHRRKLKRRDVSNHSMFYNSPIKVNQSFPRLKTSFKTIMETDLSGLKQKQTMEFVRVDGPNGVRFNSSLTSLSESPLPSAASLPVDRSSQGLNPNKAVFTIDSKTSQILIVNSRACSLLGYSSSELCALQLDQLLRSRPPSGIPARAVQEGSLNTDDGTLVLMSGKVVEMLTGNGDVIVVSLWIRQLEPNGPCLAVAEPVHIKQAVLYVDLDTGLTTGCDREDAALIFQCDHVDHIIGLHISTLIPSIIMPKKDNSEISKQIAKQKATGRTFDGTTFPLCLWIKHHETIDVKPHPFGDISYEQKKLLDIIIRVYHNVSGLLVVDDSGVVTACNHHFTMLTFGKTHCEVVGKPITSIITDFCNESRLIHPSISRSRNATISPVPNEENSDSSDIEDGMSHKSSASQSGRQSQISQVTRDKSSSALCLDKSSSCLNLYKTQTPTPTQDMVSSISTTEHKIDNDVSFVPDVTSGISNMSMDEDYYNLSISKSRSENILGSDNRENNINVANKHTDNKSTDKSDSTYFTTRKSVDYSVNGQRSKANESNLRLNLDNNKCLSKISSMKSIASHLDKSNISLDLCDSNETSADFLTPINEMPVSYVGDSVMNKDVNKAFDKSQFTKYSDVVMRNEAKYCDTVSNSPNKSSEKDWQSNIPNLRSHITTSTPQAIRHSAYRLSAAPTYPLHPLHHQIQKDATYKGIVLHKDGTELSVVYTVTEVALRGGGDVLCVWVGVTGPDSTIINASSINSTADSSISIIHKQGSHNVSRPLSISLLSQCGEEQTSGEYSKHYVTLKQIGKGAYGCVKMAYRKSDRLLVIAKFILKEKVNQQFWVDGKDENGKKVPLEASLLQSLKHPNIVTVLDVYENEKYFQMIMEKHGSGMDLFEFIERWHKLDEPLACYIFKQIGQAVEYLHSLSILHRDIKDENVIIDNKFHVKLIDFGSATFRHENILFSTFYGTTEYCSPEVLAGNKYAGPELEMWSMGVTLYILIFFENPFMDIEDTIRALLVFPKAITNDLENLLRWMLNKNPEERCTISQLMTHPWLNQVVPIMNYNFSDIINCEPHEAAPEIFYSGWGCSGSPLSVEEDAPSLTSHSATASQTDPPAHALNLPNETRTGTVLLQDTIKSGKKKSKTKKKKSIVPNYAITNEVQSDNYSHRSSAEILDISKPMSDAGITDISSDATGKSACEFDKDTDDPYDCNSWDECDQESFS